MAAFLEEYGKIIVVIIVIAALIGMAVIFKTMGMNTTTNTYDAFYNISESQRLKAKEADDKMIEEANEEAQKIMDNNGG